jgi:hypothetical protein
MWGPIEIGNCYYKMPSYSKLYQTSLERNLFWKSSFSFTYRKVARSRLSWLVAHSSIFRLFMKGKIGAYELWPQNWIVDRSTDGNLTVHRVIILHSYHVYKAEIEEISRQTPSKLKSLMVLQKWFHPIVSGLYLLVSGFMIPQQFARVLLLWLSIQPRGFSHKKE